ncbi:MAG: type II toxin-antitoxin system RelE/ParE family toxin [Xanthomonadales bacterium]|nr:type II toxin-antitoxin system RelE/ParE family toxin [Xanthomonadales bacterium]MBN8794155.1 type II toxin-antitoxin system RelE/ParE family toxin [Stenotrophomonas nitritireducens]
MRLAFTPLAEQDLEAIADYIATDNPVRALSFVRELRAQCQRITLNPSGYRLRPELGDGIRSCAYGHYVIFFEASAETVLVVRVLHGARDLPAVFSADEQ